MVKNWKKLLCFAIVAVMLISLLGACGGKEKSNQEQETTSSGTQSENKQETNADREKVTIRFTQFGNNTDDPEGMKNDPIKKAIEEAVNITLNMTQAALTVMMKT